MIGCLALLPAQALRSHHDLAGAERRGAAASLPGFHISVGVPHVPRPPLAAAMAASAAREPWAQTLSPALTVCAAALGADALPLSPPQELFAVPFDEDPFGVEGAGSALPEGLARGKQVQFRCTASGQVTAVLLWWQLQLTSDDAANDVRYTTAPPWARMPGAEAPVWSWHWRQAACLLAAGGLAVAAGQTVAAAAAHNDFNVWFRLRVADDSPQLPSEASPVSSDAPPLCTEAPPLSQSAAPVPPEVPLAGADGAACAGAGQGQPQPLEKVAAGEGCDGAPELRPVCSASLWGRPIADPCLAAGLGGSRERIWALGDARTRGVLARAAAEAAGRPCVVLGDGPLLALLATAAGARSIVAVQVRCCLGVCGIFSRHVWDFL